LFHRISITGNLQMPPLAREVNDRAAITAIAAWINSLPRNGASLPTNWSHQDIGSVGFKGDASFLNGHFNLIASGADIWDNSDAFHFASTPLDGDGQIIARLTSMQFTDPWAKAGVMFREDFSPGSKHAFMAVTAGGGSAFQWRTAENNSSGNTDGPACQIPYWVKLVRSGDTFTGYVSADGENWRRMDSVTIPMDKTIHVGLVLSAHNNSELNSSLFDNVSLTP
jgi:regulation of enolase protein 1 (concanavalin A-like superfamily)